VIFIILTWDEIKNKIEESNFDGLIDYRLSVDAHRLFLRHKYDPVSVVSVGKIDPLPHQVEAFTKMMSMHRSKRGGDGNIRMLLADDVGLGKTIMIGLVLKELIYRNEIERILIVSPAGLQIQWKEEMKNKFNEDFKIIHGDIENNPYERVDKAIISVDTVRNEKKWELIKEASWDMVVFDEAHKLRPDTLRNDFASDISDRTDHLILATATPHDGKIDNFIGIINLLNIDNEIEYTESETELRRLLEPLMIRRLKEDIVDFRGKKIFPKREEPTTVNIDYNEDEKDFYDRVEEYVKTNYKKAEESNSSTAILALYVLHRRVSSSIEAGYKSLKKRKRRILQEHSELDAEEVSDYLRLIEENDEDKKEEAEEKLLGSTASKGEDLRIELKDLDNLINIGEKLTNEEEDSKFEKLSNLIKELKEKRPEDKIIIFTEFRDTLEYLRRRLMDEGYLIASIMGGMDIEEKKRQSNHFERNADILLGTEAAGEGLNLQFANIVINYELPWNPNRLEQRIGRVYRYGQEKKVFIYNFKTAFPIDNKVLDKIIEKMESIRQIFGDNAIDVIGSLISEKEMLDMFKLSQKDENTVDEVDEFLSEKVEVLRDIDDFLIKNKFDLVKVKQFSNDIHKCINNFDIERFYLSYLENKKNFDFINNKNRYKFLLDDIVVNSQPTCINLEPYKYNLKNFEGVFDKNMSGEFVALGHKAIKSSLHDCLTNNPITLIESEEKGVILTYILKFFDGLGNEIYSEPILIQNIDEIDILDPLKVWEINELNKNYWDMVNKEDYKSNIQKIIGNEKELVDGEINELTNFVKEKNKKDLEREFDFVFSEYDWKIKNEKNKKEKFKEKGQKYLINSIENNIEKYKKEFREYNKEKLKREEINWKICGPIAVGLLAPYADRKFSGEDGIDNKEAKKEVEKLGMKEVFRYEKESNREPKDVSADFTRGYDILSDNDKEKRHIEVKSFATIGKVQITSNEWRVASHLLDEYYLYVVKNVYLEPEITVIKNPYEKLQDNIRKVPIEDYKIIIDELP